MGGELIRTFRAARSVPDGPYLQETGRKVPMASPATAVAALPGLVFVGTQDGVRRWDRDGLVAEPGVTSQVHRLVVARGIPGP